MTRSNQGYAEIAERVTEISRSGPPENLLLLGAEDRLSGRLIRLVLDSITEDQTFKDLAQREIAARDAEFASYPEFLGFLRDLIHGLIRQDAESLGFDAFELNEDLARYRETVADSLDAYDLTTKTKPEAVHWPNPDRDPRSSIYRTQPYIENLGLVTKETPIGSAGSCFAIELARSLQDRGFNYVSTESEHEDLSNGVIVDDYDASRSTAGFSAHYGLLFNTPSFRQLAERAFGLRELPRVLYPIEINRPGGKRLQLLQDPFRESVFFHSYEAYEANYEKHAAAVREAFLRAEVFVITPGLNECWEFMPCGSVLSRNPHRLDFYPLVRRRVLTVGENIENLQRMIDIVRAHNPSFKVILSLSPVPFIATTRGRDCHVVNANSHSKAVLRVAIEEVVEANRDVFYFPSYELVTVCTENPWAPDQRHVNRQTVERVMALFEAMYVR